MPFFDAIPVDYLQPGETTTVAVDGFPVAVANVDGAFFASQNLCPHQGTTLGGRPLVERCAIVCSQHSRGPANYPTRTCRSIIRAIVTNRHPEQPG